MNEIAVIVGCWRNGSSCEQISEALGYNREDIAHVITIYKQSLEKEKIKM
jgi:uncharacterized protein (DUF433 family)